MGGWGGGQEDLSAREEKGQCDRDKDLAHLGTEVICLCLLSTDDMGPEGWRPCGP